MEEEGELETNKEKKLLNMEPMQRRSSMAKLGMSDKKSIKMFGAKPPEPKKPLQKTDSSDEDLDTILVVGPRRKKFFDFLIISMDSTIYHYFTLLMTILTLASSMMYASSAAFRTHVEAKQG